MKYFVDSCAGCSFRVRWVCCESSCQRDSVKIESGNISFWSRSSQSVGSVAVVHGLNCSEACGIFPNQGSNPCLLHWQVDSLPLSHQGCNFLFHLAPGEDWVPERRAVLANVIQPRLWASQLHEIAYHLEDKHWRPLCVFGSWGLWRALSLGNYLFFPLSMVSPYWSFICVLSSGALPQPWASTCPTSPPKVWNPVRS